MSQKRADHIEARSACANKVLGRSGSFWQDEYYDHLIRDEAEFTHAVEYILDNARRAGLRGWPWVHSFTLVPL